MIIAGNKPFFNYIFSVGHEMKVDTNTPSEASKIKITKENMPKKERLSDREIKEKLAAHVELSNPKKVPIPLEGKTESIEENSLVNSDVKENNPSSPETREKLKTVLTSNAFNFNPQERENLERILKA